MQALGAVPSLQNGDVCGLLFCLCRLEQKAPEQLQQLVEGTFTLVQQVC